MRVRVLLHAPVREGTILEYVAYLSEALQTEQRRVTVQVGERPSWPRDVPFPPELVDDQENPTPGLQFRSIRWAVSRFVTSLRNSHRRLALAREKQVDLVHLQLILPWVDWLFIRLHKRSSRVICTVHDVVPHVAKLPPLVDRLLRRSCYRAADGLIFHSQANLEQFQAVYSFVPPRAAVIPHGLEWHSNADETQVLQSKGHLGIEKDSLVVLMFGELRPTKGLEVLIPAFRQLRHAVPKAFLLIAGSIHPVVAVDELMAELGTLPEGSWSWRRGWVDDSEMADYFQAAAIVVLPYTSFASQSGVLAKAYAYSRPLVVSNVGSLGTTVKEDRTGLVVPPLQIGELAEAMLRLLTDTSLHNQCQNNIIQAAQTTYAWKAIANRTTSFYKDVLVS